VLSGPNAIDPPAAHPHPVSVKTLRFAILLGLLLGGCQPIHRGSVDGPGGGAAAAGELRPGQFVRTVIDNAAFFRNRPLQEGSADMLLQLHTAMRLIQTDPMYSKVELDDGRVGFVPTATLELIPNASDPDNRPPVPDPIPRPDDVRPDPLSPIPPTLDPGAAPIPVE